MFVRRQQVQFDGHLLELERRKKYKQIKKTRSSYSLALVFMTSASACPMLNMSSARIPHTECDLWVLRTRPTLSAAYTHTFNEPQSPPTLEFELVVA